MRILLLFCCLLAIIKECPAGEGKLICIKQKSQNTEVNKTYFSENKKDTSEVHCYSYEERRTIPYLKQAKLEEDKLVEVTVSEGGNVMLKAPDFGQEALYAWKGPMGFTSFSQMVMIENVTFAGAGYYNVTIHRKGLVVIGKIRVIVKEKQAKLTHVELPPSWIEASN